MNGLQDQISELHQKVEQLYQVVERIGTQMTTLLLEKEQYSAALTKIESAQSESSAQSRHVQAELGSKHKDILDDSTSWEHMPPSERELTPEIQIRRLTAQLTAAYNRIAVLEEQLFSCRMQS